MNDLREAVARTGRRYPFHIDAAVVLPNHLHTVWALPPPKQERRSAVRRERGIWQRRFWEHLIRDEHDYARHVEYCYINPVKHGIVSRVRDWPHSSFHRDVRRGIFPIDWAGEVEAAGGFGEAWQIVGRNSEAYCAASRRMADYATGYGAGSRSAR